MNGKDGNISAKENKSRFTPLTIILLAVLILYCLSLAYLIWWCISSSFKINQVVFDFDPYGFFPAYGRYKNSEATAWEITEAKKEGSLFFYTYRHILETFKWKTQSAFGKASRTVYMWEMYGNSLLYAGGCALAATIVPCITAYACARFKYKFSRFIHTLVIVVMMIPIVGSLPSEIRMATSLGIINEIWGLWIMKANFLGIYFLVFYDIFKALPSSFVEAAKIDGANNFQVLFRIALPLVKNTFFTVLLIKFIEFWNDYQSPAVFLSSYPTVAFNLNYLMNASLQIEDQATALVFVPSELPSRMAAVVLTATPISILFIVFQKRLLGNLTIGGVKG